MIHIYIPGIKTSYKYFIFPLIWTFFLIIPALAQEEEKENIASKNQQWESEFYEENEQCFKCHGQSRYELINEYSKRKIYKLMCSGRVVKREDFYVSNHRSFSCNDCHDDDYNTFPHPRELRTEEPYMCLDCHGYDEAYSQFHFEEIEVEYQNSIHFGLEEEGFSCWKCHNPHTYKINVRNTENLIETIVYDNSICLDCHADFDRFQLLTDREGINIIEEHQWLPNQALHFQNVRCIDCHTHISDSILVAHQLMPKDSAIKRCVECHSQNSILMSTLYKFESKEQRSKTGYLNAVMLNKSFVIGANRNYYLNIISLVIFLVTIAGIAIHASIIFISKIKSR